MPYYDFDSARREQERIGEPLTMRVLGEDVEFPSEVPGAVMVILLRARRAIRDGELDEGSEASVDMVVELLEATVGRERLEGWLMGGLGPSDLFMLMSRCWRHWGNPNPPAPENGADTGQRKTTRKPAGSRSKNGSSGSNAGRTR